MQSFVNFLRHATPRFSKFAWFGFFTEVSYTIASLPKLSKVISMVYDTWL